ncbi:hypothetical protein GRF59_14350 [Paenibacillus sp. HJL G12]|uniref:Uncharacterized protein n=1 Tax=Paenibacillus dendrobii TaxID=2691084 RepID=A0A7X3LIP7_9BACL|nr:hypothetical protein [Paenibacillus dendrobii]MWV44798.1 hypothetical protein [Paenibacillus dendrobii]
MFARVSFDDNQIVTRDELAHIEDYLCDEITYSELVEDNEGNVMEFYSWNHTYSKEEAEKEDSTKKLVRESNKVKLGSVKEYLSDVESLIKTFPKLKFKVRGMIQSSHSQMLNMVEQMKDIESKLTNALMNFNETIEFNQRCDVHIGNIGLLNINQLGYAVDKCTEELQDIISTGWRILAVCPQPDQRRPDYVLGRYNPEENGVVRCERF